MSCLDGTDLHGHKVTRCCTVAYRSAWKPVSAGLWVYDSEKGAYEFYEPSLSDIPNAALLFEESYTVSAEVNFKSRILSYTRWQF